MAGDVPRGHRPLMALVFTATGYLATLLTRQAWWGCRFSRRRLDPRQVVQGYVVPVADKNT